MNRGPYRPLGARFVWVAALIVAGASTTCGQSAANSSSTGAAESASTAAQQRFRAAQRLAGEGALDKALEAVRQGLKIDPRSTEGLNLLGIIYDQQHDYGQSLAAFKRALEINPRSTETHNNLGISYYTQKKLDLAAAEFQHTLKLNPHDRTANYNMGMVELAQGKAKEAINYLRRVQPPDASTSLSLAQAYFADHETTEGLQLAQSLSNQAPNDVRVHFSLGVFLAAQRQYAPAIHELELADALKPGTPEILHNLGQAYLRDKKPEKAQQVLERAASLQPDSVDALYLLGQAYNDQHKSVQGLEVLLRAHKLAPENPDIIFLIARLSMQQSYYEDAIQLLEQGVKIAPKRADLRAALGESYFVAGKVDKAKEEFQTLLEIEPSATSYSFMGLCYRHLGKFDEAKKYFEEGLKKDPQNAACLYSLGYIANKQGDQAGAEKLLEQAIQVAPDYDDALFELASVRMSEKKFTGAVPLLQQCTKLAPHPAEAYYKLAIAERALHQTQAAERDMKIFETLARDPKPGPYPFQHLFDYLSQRSALPQKSQTELDLSDLQQEVKRHSENPRNLYLLAEAYLKLGQADEARKVIAQLDQLSGGDARTMLGTGVLLARYRLYPKAIQHFQAALAADPTSDDARYNLATTYFRMRDYPHALEMMQKVSPQAQDDPYLSLLGDIDTHLGRTAEAIHIFEQATQANPDNDSNYVSLALAELDAGDAGAARQALGRGLERIPDSGHILWGMGVVCVFDGDNAKAEAYFKRAVELLPEWQGGYSALGTFYYQTGQVEKARETLDRYQKLFPHGLLNVSRIQQTLDSAAPRPQAPQTLSSEARRQFLGIALALADETP